MVSRALVSELQLDPQMYVSKSRLDKGSGSVNHTCTWVCINSLLAWPPFDTCSFNLGVWSGPYIIEWYSERGEWMDAQIP